MIDRAASPEESASAPLELAFVLDKRAPAAEQIYAALKEAIISCRLLPNAPISEMRLCGMFGISRSPVRIALTRLAEDGLIDIYPQRGTYVSPIKLRQVRESHFARTALEVALVERAADNWTPDYSARARAIIEDQRTHAAARDTWKFYLDNESFHIMIAQCADLEGVWRTVESVKMLWDRVGHLANPVPGHMSDIIAEHLGIIEALDRHDPQAAVAAMKTHMQSVFNAIARLKPLHSTYFVEE